MSDREDLERVVPRGPKGDRGDRGERGLSRVQGRAVVVLFALAVLLAGSDLFWSAHEADVVRAQAAAQQAAQQRAGAIVERKLCTTLAKQAALKPPAGNPATNPARAFDQNWHALLAQLGPDVGCAR